MRKSGFFALALAFALLAPPAIGRADSQGDEEALREMADCAKIEKFAERIFCYDHIAIGAWHMMASSRAGIFMSTLSVADHDDRWVRPKLLLACEEKVVLIFINWRHTLEEGLKRTSGKPTITVRLAGGTSETHPWEFAAENRVTYLRGQQADQNAARVEFIGRMIRAGTLTVRVALGPGSEVVAEYKLQGLADAIKPLRDSCGLGS
ncbi:MAG: hypothetical protein IIA14_05495 [SAR324 cluster bacterium]|nr:hypothetical protein [SAR324 cluster bacterium]